MSQAIRAKALRSLFRASPVFALLWEQWRVTRGAIGLAVVMTLGVAYPLHIADTRVQFVVLDPAFISTFAYVLGLLVVAIFFAVDHSAVGEVRLGIPARQQLMPVRRSVLVIGHFTYRMGMMAVLAALLGIVLRLLYGRDAFPLGETTTIAVCAMAYVLAISWTVGRHGLSFGVLAALVLVWPLYLASIITAEDAFGGAPQTGPLLFAGVSSAIALGGALRRETPPRGARPGAAKLVERILSAAPGRFATAESALWWYEWRRRGLVLPILELAFCVPYVLAATIMPLSALFVYNPRNPQGILPNAALSLSRFSAVSYVAISLPIAAFVTGAYFTMLDRRESESNFAAGSLQAPTSFQSFLRTRFWISFASVFTTLGVVAILIAAVDIMAWSAGVPRENWLVLRELGDFRTSPGGGILLLAALTILCWSLTFLAPFVAGAAVCLACMVSMGFSTPLAYFIYAWVLTVAFASATVYFGRRAVSEHLIGAKGLIKLGALAFLCECTTPLWFDVFGLRDIESIPPWLTLTMAPVLAVLFEMHWLRSLRNR